MTHFASCPDAQAWRQAPARRHSPTSSAAATAIAPKVNALHRKVIDAIRRTGPLTDEELAVALNMNPSTARPRRIELQRMGVLVHAGTARTKSGRSAVRWGLKEET